MARSESKQGNNLRNRIGFAVTGAYVLWLVGLAIWKWSAILDLKPNEFGDMLAGAASPVAFLWLVLGYMQQGEELGHSVAAWNCKLKSWQRQSNSRKNWSKLTENRC